MLARIKDWLITSSANPANTSLAIKGIATIIGAYILKASEAACTFGLYCTGIDVAWINSAVQAASNIAFAIALFTGAAMTIWGLGRKLWLGRWSHPNAV